LVRSAGIPELGIEEVEPIVIDEINLALGSGPDGYRATFKDIQAYGVSNLTVNQVRYATPPHSSAVELVSIVRSTSETENSSFPPARHTHLSPFVGNPA